MGRCDLDNKKHQMYHKMGIPHLYKSPHKDPNTMDVDAMHIQKPPEEHIDLACTGADGRPFFTDKQKEALKVLSKCLRCGGNSHFANQCTKYPTTQCWSRETGSGFCKPGHLGWGAEWKTKVQKQEVAYETEEDKVQALMMNIQETIKEASQLLNENNRAKVLETTYDQNF